MSSKKIHVFWRLASIATLGGLRTRVFTKKKSIYLTFDDGPHPEHTPILLDLLRRYEARACFFLVGTSCLNNPGIVRRISNDGHHIGNHSNTHPNFPKLPFRSQWKEFARADQIIARFTFRPPCQFSLRPPRGKVTWAAVVYSFLRRRRLVLWSRDSLDGTLTGEGVCFEFENSPVRNGDVLLFHDDSSVCIDALQKLLPKWKLQGFQFVA